MEKPLDMNEAPIKILLVEDNPAHAFLLRELLADQSDVRFKLTHVEGLELAYPYMDEGDLDVRNAARLDHILHAPGDVEAPCDLSRRTVGRQEAAETGVEAKIDVLRHRDPIVVERRPDGRPSLTPDRTGQRPLSRRRR